MDDARGMPRAWRCFDPVRDFVVTVLWCDRRSSEMADHRPPRPIRLHQDVYRQPGVFLITICTYRRQRLFGTCNDGVVTLSPLGIVCRTCLLAISDHFPVRVDAWVIMPDHLHVILVAGRPFSSGIVQVVAGFKAAVSREWRISRPTAYFPIWQRRFHDRLLTSRDALARARRYIAANPANWPG
ncbi:MAG TPA: transposase [Gemmatimonadales bacterium]|nr:transposase [Gemmatimonadales bacterium]